MLDDIRIVPILVLATILIGAGSKLDAHPAPHMHGEHAHGTDGHGNDAPENRAPGQTGSTNQTASNADTTSRASDAPAIDAGRSAKKMISLSGPTAAAFQQFSSTVTTRTDPSVLIIESNGLPAHDMMVGIRSWQQQVPLPQPFVGSNAWRLPLNPKPSTNPISVRSEPLQGAIALAVNGVPIFCALNNRGEDTYLAGELDQWGGHCGRGDDYHYHIAPVHLEKTVGVGNPIAFALDGYPIIGLTEADGTEPKELDLFNGHAHDGNYHYHATKTFPYINGGLHGVVTLRGDQIDQPRDSPVRSGQRPLRGARITGFDRQGDEFKVDYEVSGKPAQVRYKMLSNESVEFTYTDSNGSTSSQTYQRGRRRGSLLPGMGAAFGLLVLCGTVLAWRKIRLHQA